MRFNVVNGGQVTVTALVIHRQGRALVVRSRVGAVEWLNPGVNHFGVGRKVDAQLNERGFFGVAGGLLGNGEHHALIDVSATGRVNRRSHQALAGRVDHVELLVEHESAVAGKNILQTVGRLERKETVAGNGQVQRIG